ncbi:unnamed protein product, partial [Symbiodinium necroappetens]
PTPEALQRIFAKLTPADVHLGVQAMTLANRLELQKLLRPLFKADACENKVCSVKKCTKKKDVCNLRDAHLIRAAGLLGKTKRRGVPLQKGDPVCGACRCLFSRAVW